MRKIYEKIKTINEGWSVYEGNTGERLDDFVRIAWFLNEVDAELWILEKNEDQKRE